MKIIGIGCDKDLVRLFLIFNELKIPQLLVIDKEESLFMSKLIKQGISTLVGFDRYQIKSDDLIIYSDQLKNTKIIEDIFTLKFSEQQPLKIWSVGEFMGEISKYFRSFENVGEPLESIALVFGDSSGEKGYLLNKQLTEDIRQIFEAIFSGRKLPYPLVKKWYLVLGDCKDCNFES